VLRGLFPTVARSQLRDLQEEYRGRWYDQHGIVTEILHWTAPETVWAADFSDPPAPVDGCFDHVLATRDLASSMQLAALPTLDADADTAVETTETLFLEHGAPLVLKSDNGSPFIAQAFQELLDRWKVFALLSPPRTPRYNGGVEAGNGSVKTRTCQEAVRHGRIGCWTCDDLEAVRLQANLTARPWGDRNPTPQEVWDRRTPVTPDQRRTFLQCVERMQREVRTELAYGEDTLLGRAERAIVARAAARRALESLGYLQVQRRRITPPFSSPLRARIS
jgi:hypothetical protein